MNRRTWQIRERLPDDRHTVLETLYIDKHGEDLPENPQLEMEGVRQ